ncbi:hypothetical protein LTS15_000077 [Exophiala xenobiotica]|nr:hypothetical protein LTS15_000077 [Exophiala xenobiotica]
MVEFRQRFEEFLSRRDGDEKTKIIQEYKFDGANPPGSKFLIPDVRTVSFGTKIEHPSHAKDHQECVELSAWYGRSGSMVCTEKDGRSTIIGIIQGGEEASDCNLILLFNTEMTEWWNAATELGESPDTQAIGRRFVMA